MKAPFLFLFLLLMPTLAFGAETNGLEDLNIVTLLSKGGYTMIALGVLSVFTFVLILLYFMTLRRGAVVTNKFMNNAEAMIRKRDYLGLVTYCQRRSELVARVTQKALDFMTKNPTATQTDIREVAEAEGSRQGGVMTQRISYLADIGGIAPMVGLLGTVIGMIKSFIEIAEGKNEGLKQLQLAEGIWEALITTAVGLIISIFAMAFYSYFRGKVQRHIAELEAAGTHILALVGGQMQQPRQNITESQPLADDYAAAPAPPGMRG
ncbi:MotA/TolQ/ExbB proton channel family protein [Akkermansiaceae bacterium]|nr:MotA/TolQ/ExbB proton channel family protein [Akkermansiaceae bacterium]MDB4310866.1 MotA/TolQ/ExbB proton channel family protein [bacterium]MDB0068388.1 MotA/TolQ/ExbB proton channel family protein [Akkermansiaceae bacterium]MDB4258286.1 MotA/TolQ/ExbB proton channel family protein [Akkermansiaceae bacterium]MDB4259058.1 MotA/TolQ/ExbB proton channel family protein [Akkermansiaceae bacterium]